MPDLIPKLCEHCQKPIEDASPRQIFCDRKCKDAAHTIRWKAANPEKWKAMMKQADEKRRAKIREISREYRELHKDRYNATRREKYHENQAEEAAKRRKWFWDNHEMSIERGKRFHEKTRQEAPWKLTLLYARARAKKLEVPFSLTHPWAKARWTGRCEITDIPFVLKNGHGPGTYSPTLDRIKPELGYVPDNCRFIIHAVNAMKSVGTDDEMLAIAKAITSRNSLHIMLRDQNDAPPNPKTQAPLEDLAETT